MAVDGAGNSQAIDRDELRRGLVTSSTKRRITELSGLQHQVEDDCKYAHFTRESFSPCLVLTN